MKKIDATIVLNLHKEGLYLKRTLLSLDESVKHAIDAGFSIQLVAVLDRPDTLTENILRDHDHSHYEKTTIIKVDNGSLGLSRNDGILAANGEFIFTADGDDLISENFILDTLTTARNSSHKSLFFPEFLFAFGANYHISIYRPLDEVTPLAFILMHPYISRVCAHRSVFEQLKYEDLRLSNGYAYEDWHFNANAVAHGLDIQIVPNVILFYRQRQNSLLQEANALSVRQIAPSKLFETSTWIQVNQPFIYNTKTTKNTTQVVGPADHSILEGPNIREAIQRANLIESQIRLEPFKNCAVFTNTEYPLDAAIAYFHICELLDGLVFNDVFLFPFISEGGAEKYFLEILQSLYRQCPEKNCLIILGENFNGASWRSRVPPNAIVIDLQNICDKLSLYNRLLITLKLIEATAKDARIHIRQSVFGDNFLQSFGVLFKDQPLFYYRFADDIRVENGTIFTDHSSLSLISETIETVSYIITDNETIARKDAKILGCYTEKWKVLYAPITVPRQRSRASTQKLSEILWASRLDNQKRPAIVPLIAEKLLKFKSNLKITAYGSSVFAQYTPSIFDNYDNLCYAGPFNGFSSLPLDQFSVFLYTSWYDGVPNVVLEAMAQGYIVIAPDVGGLSEVIKDGHTGILLPSLVNDNKMAELYADALLRVSSDRVLAEKLSTNAVSLLQERHSYDVYDKNVAKLFELGSKHD